MLTRLFLAFVVGYLAHMILMYRWLRRLGFDSLTQLEDDLGDLSAICGSLLAERSQGPDEPAYRIRHRDMN